jgi:hypothetical protein
MLGLGMVRAVMRRGGIALAALALVAFTLLAAPPPAQAQPVNPVLREAVVDALDRREREYVFPGSIIVFQGDFNGDRFRDALAFAYFRPPGGALGLTVLLLENTVAGYAVVATPEVLGRNPRNARFSPGRVQVSTTMPNGTTRRWTIDVPF